MTLLPVDGCPDCLASRGVTVLAHPYHVEPQPTSTGIYAHYACPVCKHEWFTGWAAGAACQPCPGCAECQPERGAA